MSSERMETVRRAMGPGTGLTVRNDDESDPWEVLVQELAEMTDAEFQALLERIHEGNQQAAEIEGEME